VYETYEELRYKNKMTNARYTKLKFIYDEKKKTRQKDFKRTPIQK